MIGPSRVEGTSTRQICDTNQLTQIWWCSSMSGLVHEQGHLEPYSYTYVNKELCYRTTRCQSKSYQPSCTTNWMELDGYGWPIVVKQPPLINCHIGVVDKLGRPRQWRHVLLIMRLTCPGEIEISKSWVWGKVSEGSTLTFWDTQVSFITQCEIGGRKPTCQEQLDSSSPFDTIPACDEQTDGQDTRPR